MPNEQFPSLLKPSDVELFNLNNEIIEIPKCILTFKKWLGLPISYTFGGKGLVDFDGKPVFAELAVMKLFKVSGWNARWIETYGASDKAPRHFSNWLETASTFKEQPVDMIQEEHINNHLNEIFILNKYTYSGCWDVLGWLDNKIVFAETKRSKQDKFRSTQHNWLLSGLAYGLTPENFLIIEWDFIK